jgi:hypothetical protein
MACAIPQGKKLNYSPIEKMIHHGQLHLDLAGQNDVNTGHISHRIREKGKTQKVIPGNIGRIKKSAGQGYRIGKIHQVINSGSPGRILLPVIIVGAPISVQTIS